MVTPAAVPVPEADELETVTVKPIEVPVLTVAASAVFVIDRAGASTFSVADAWTEDALPAEAVAVFA
jgi:hypothetical protein